MKTAAKVDTNKGYWTWNSMYQKLYEKVGHHQGLYMHEVLQWRTPILGYWYTRLGWGARILQARGGLGFQWHDAPNNTVLHPIAFARKGITSAETRNSIIKREALGIIHGLEKVHCYCFAWDVGVIMDPRPLVAIYKKDVTTLSWRSPCILLCTHQYSIGIIHKTDLQLYIANWFSRHNHTEGKDEEVTGFNMTISVVETCTGTLAINWSWNQRRNTNVLAIVWWHGSSLWYGDEG